MDSKEFDEKFDKNYDAKKPKFDESLNIVLVGKVSAGKSSLINAIFERDRENPISPVGSISGITTEVTAYRLDKNVLIVDCPGLDDVVEENSEETKKFLDEIDLGLFVITGSADASQKGNYDTLRANCKKSIVVLNKIDEWDDLEISEYQDVFNQWKQVLGAEKLFGTCTKGYNPKTRKDAPMDIRGVDELRKEILDFLEKEGKDLLLAKNLKNKDKYAIGIITSSLVAVAVEAFIPGSAVYISATQAASISAMQYLYTGEVLNKSSTLSVIGAFAGESIGMTLFLLSKSFLPPTGLIDIAAAFVAIIVTFAMLATVKWLLENNYKLDDKAELKSTFKHFKELGEEFKKISFDDFKNKEAIFDLVARLLSTAWKPS